MARIVEKVEKVESPQRERGKKGRVVEEPKKKKGFEKRLSGVRINMHTGKITKASGDSIIDFDYVVRLVYDKKESPIVRIEGQTFDNKRKQGMPDTKRISYLMLKSLYEQMGELIVEIDAHLAGRKVKPQKYRLK